MHRLIIVSYTPQRQNTWPRTCMPSEDSDQPAYSGSFRRIFTGRISNIQGCSFSRGQ